MALAQASCFALMAAMLGCSACTADTTSSMTVWCTLTDCPPGLRYPSISSGSSYIPSASKPCCCRLWLCEFAVTLMSFARARRMMSSPMRVFRLSNVALRTAGRPVLGTRSSLLISALIVPDELAVHGTRMLSLPDAGVALPTWGATAVV